MHTELWGLLENILSGRSSIYMYDNEVDLFSSGSTQKFEFDCPMLFPVGPTMYF
jgi:hypothetical protein